MAVIELYPARKETSFERANRIAEERKRAAWAAYVPLPREAFIDDWLHQRVTIAVIGDTGTRSTFGSAQKRATGDTIMRPTELTATANCFSSTGQGQEAIVVIRLEREDMRESRKCARCMRVQTLDKFDRDKRYPSGVAFYCRRCREELRVRKAA